MVPPLDNKYYILSEQGVTNLVYHYTLDELKHPKDLARARIYDRVLERCVPLKINNQNIRELNAAANMQEARKILNSGT